MSGPLLAPWPRKTWCSVTKEYGLQGAAHHVRPATGAMAPEDVVLGDEGIRVCRERRTTSGWSARAGLFLRLCFSSIYKKGIMKWPDWRGADSDEGKGREVSNL